MKKRHSILFLLIFYFFFQLSSIDYGFKVNDINYLKNISLSKLDIKAFTEKESINTKENIETDSKSWEYRYKLYSVNADEMMPIMALSKIDINNKRFDPQIYKYGGAFIYPLGFYYYCLDKIGLIEKINFSSIISNDNLIDKIYFYGRFFVLLFFTLSAFVFYKCLKLIIKNNSAIIFTSIYLFVPSSIMYSQIIKPNWYALFWFNLFIFYSLKYFLIKKKENYLILGIIFSGLAIGSSVLYTPAIILTFLVIFINLKKNIKINFLIYSITICTCVFFITNPYILVNFTNFINESQGEYNWIFKNLNLKNTFLFFNNSFIQGFGILLSLTLFYFLLKKTKKNYEKKIKISIFLLILFGAIISSFETWHIQFRYIPYILTISLIYLSYKIKNKKYLALILIATIFQSIPMKMSYYDENNIKYSTRLKSANWINSEIINKKKSICKKEFVPFDFPPINFTKVKIEKNCDYEILVLRQPNKIKIYDKDKIIKKFEPRFQFANIPLVFNHINPLIIILKNYNE